MWHTPEIFILHILARLYLRSMYGKGLRGHGDAHFQGADQQAEPDGHFLASLCFFLWSLQTS